MTKTNHSLNLKKGSDVKELQPTLFVVATPIGTLADFSPRARQVLETVDFIACEDTRRTKELLMALNLQHGPLVSLHEHNEREKSAGLVEKLLKSPQQKAALVSDAGTPAISDPGALFVDACHRASVRVESVPGPSSLVAAAAASGFLRPRLLFAGFLSRNQREQIDEFNRWKYSAPCLVACFESPNRVLATLKNAAEVFPREIEVCVSREISKKFEEHIRGPLADVIQRISEESSLRGECVICFDLPNSLELSHDKENLTLDQLKDKVSEQLAQDPSIRLKALCKKLADEHKVNAKDLYNAVVESRSK